MVVLAGGILVCSILPFGLLGGLNTTDPVAQPDLYSRDDPLRSAVSGYDHVLLVAAGAHRPALLVHLCGVIHPLDCIEPCITLTAVLK